MLGRGGSGPLGQAHIDIHDKALSRPLTSGSLGRTSGLLRLSRGLYYAAGLETTMSDNYWEGGRSGVTGTAQMETTWESQPSMTAGKLP